MSGRTLTAGINTELAQATTAPRWLVEIIFDSGALRLWNGLGDLTALSQTWTGAGKLGFIQPIRETQETVASGVTLTLHLDPDLDLPDEADSILNIALAEEYQGRPVTIYQAQIDHTTGALIADPFIRFKGKLDVMADSEIPGGATITVTAENRLIDLERARPRTYTPEDHKSDYADDTFFDGVAALQNRQIQLGY